MKKKALYTLVLGVLFMSVATGLSAADANRSGLYSRSSKAETVEAVAAPATGLYSPLRANPTVAGQPGMAEGIGTETPIGDATGFILLAGAAYLGFAFLRKRRHELIS